MADYIKRSDAINAIESLPTWWADEGGYYGGMQQPRVALLEPEDVITAIRNIPSADVMPREDYERACITLNKIAEVLRDG